MSNAVCCPKCHGTNVRSVDSESSYHPSKGEVANGVPRWDNELYMTFICDDCNPMAESDGYFKVVFNLVLQPKQPNI